jgi:hypothetical protein
MFNFAFGAAAGANVVVPFMSRPKAAPAPKGWGQDEIAEAYRVIDILARGGLAVHLVSGLSDEGDPWAAVLRDDNEDVVVHFARIDGRVILASAASEKVFSGPSLAAALRSVLETQPLILPPGGGSLFLHPATILAAFIATALINSVSDATAAPVDGARDAQARMTHEAATAGARQGDGGYSPALVAAAIASVATAFSLTMDEVSLYGEDPLLELSAMQSHAEHGPDRHFSFEQIGWDGVLDDPLGVLQHGIRGLDAWARVKPEPVMAIDPDQADSDGALHALMAYAEMSSKLDPSAWRLAGIGEETAEPSASAPLMVEDGGLLAVSILPEEAANDGASTDGKLAAAPLAAHPGFIQAGGEDFYWEARFLFGMASPSDSPSWGAASAEQLRSTDLQLAENGQLRTSLTDTAAIVTVARDVAPDVKATILKDFTLDHGKELAADPGVLGQVLAALKALPFMPEVDRVVIFEADDVATDVFMMFKGVAMVRGDMLGEDLQALALPQQVAFEMTNGEYFTLLGVIDV